jgi:thiamine-phosphate pyrophosphorylase
LRSKHFAAGLPPLSPALKTPIVCYVTDRKSLAEGDNGADVIGRIRATIAAGVDWVQIREKVLSGRELLGLVREAVAAGGGARVIVNDRLDMALAAGAAGVHLGRESLGARDVVRWCKSSGGNAPADFLVGVSCHSLADAREAESAGAAYIFFGPVFDTPSKRGMGEPQGVARLEEICRSVAIRVLAIGGVNEQNAGDCIRAGAAGIAAIRLFQDTRDAETLKDAVKRLHALGASR